MIQRSAPPKRLAERRFPDHRVDIPVGLGLDVSINHMHAWRRQRFGKNWEQHHYSTPRGRGVVPIDYARFYFEGEADAEGFRRAAVARGWL